MKKYYLFAAAVTMLTACTNSEKMTNDLSYDGPVMIGFETFHEKSTKASVNAPSDLIKDNDGFGVYGFKHKNQRAKDNTGIIDLSDVAPENNVNYVTSIFNNVKVWYVSDNFNTTPTQGFTYDIPKYWDKDKYYTFFAYAPHTSTIGRLAEDAVGVEGQEGYQPAVTAIQGIIFDQSKGLFTRTDIKALQSANKTTTVNVNNEARTKFIFTSVNESTNENPASEKDIIDYLIAPYEHNQKYNATNQNDKGYTGVEKTVGFTFSHILSKLNVYVKAEDQSAASGHKYSGVKDIQITKLNIQNLPNATSEIAIYAQNAPDAVAGTWTPANYSTYLNIVDGTNAASAENLFILDGGTVDNEGVITNPTTYIDQQFHYFVAPNTPANEAHYILNIDYVINYVDNTVEPFTRTIDLSTENAAFTTMAQNNTYNIKITIGLTQIYFTVDAINDWVVTSLPETNRDTDIDIQ